MTGEDPHDLARFTAAQDEIYDRILAELKGGRKRTHWMWFVFPQIDGLGFSATTTRYSIKSLAEARAYLAHPVLGARLRECTQAVLATDGRTAFEIFGSPDNMKLKSSMTLFGAVADSVFDAVLEKFYGGERDTGTLELLAKLAEPE